MLQCAYRVCYKGWSASVFSEMLSFAKIAGGDVPECHDSGSVFTECRSILFSVLQADWQARFQTAEAWGISLGETWLEI